MMLLLLLAQTIDAPAPQPPASGTDKTAPSAIATRYDACVDLATGDPDAGVAEATQWRATGGGFFARQCLGIAFANQGRFPSAADEFEGAAQDAEVAHDARAADYWAQGGNARLAAGQPEKPAPIWMQRLPRARLLACSAARRSSTVPARWWRWAILTRRARISTGRLRSLAEDPLIWLASATLARRMDDLPRARTDIAEAFRRSGR